MAGSQSAALGRLMGIEVFVLTASQGNVRSKSSLGLSGWKAKAGLISTRSLGKGSSDLRGLGGVLGLIQGSDESEKVGDSVGGIGGQTVLVSLKLTCLTFVRGGSISTWLLCGPLALLGETGGSVTIFVSEVIDCGELLE